MPGVSRHDWSNWGLRRLAAQHHRVPENEVCQQQEEIMETSDSSAPLDDEQPDGLKKELCVLLEHVLGTDARF